MNDLQARIHFVIFQSVFFFFFCTYLQIHPAVKNDCRVYREVCSQPADHHFPDSAQTSKWNNFQSRWGEACNVQFYSGWNVLRPTQDHPTLKFILDVTRNTSFIFLALQIVTKLSQFTGTLFLPSYHSSCSDLFFFRGCNKKSVLARTSSHWALIK